MTFSFAEFPVNGKTIHKLAYIQLNLPIIARPVYGL